MVELESPHTKSNGLHETERFRRLGDCVLVYVFVYVFVCVRVCVGVRVRVYMCVFVCVTKINLCLPKAEGVGVKTTKYRVRHIFGNEFIAIIKVQCSQLAAAPYIYI